MNSDILDLKKQIDNEINYKKSSEAHTTKKMIKLEMENEKLKSQKSLSSNNCE